MRPFLLLAVLRTAALALLAPAASSLGQGFDVAELERRFARYDATGGGWLSGTELDACACRHYDLDGDNEVTFAEFTAGVIVHGDPTEPAPAQPAQPAPAVDSDDYDVQFERYDVNGDGFLSGTELDACGCHRYDTVGDGQIHYTDFYTGRLLEEPDVPTPPPTPPSPEPSRPVAGPAGGPALATYDCYQSNPYLYAFKSFTLLAGNRYEAFVGNPKYAGSERLGSGRYSYDPATQLITFSDGPWHEAELAGIYPTADGPAGSIALKPRDNPHLRSRGFAGCYLQTN